MHIGYMNLAKIALIVQNLLVLLTQKTIIGTKRCDNPFSKFSTFKWKGLLHRNFAKQT